MFENLQDGLKSAFKSLSGKGKLTEGNMRDGLKIVEQSLLEADVSYEVVQHFMQRVTEQALGEKVLLSLKPHEQLIGIVHNELVGLLGPVDDSLQRLVHALLPLHELSTEGVLRSHRCFELWVKELHPLQVGHVLSDLVGAQVGLGSEALGAVR